MIVLLDGRLAASFTIGHLVTHLRFLDVAVEDFDSASVAFRETLEAHSRLLASYDDLAEYEASVASGDAAALTAAGVRFHYRLDCAYAEARRVLDRVVAVVHELLPRTDIDLGTTHNGFGPLLVRRCAGLGLEVPASMLDQIDDLARRIKVVRDQIEHVKEPLAMRLVDARGELMIVTTRTVVRSDGEAVEIQFEPAGVVRESIHEYIDAMVDLLERGHGSRQ